MSEAVSIPVQMPRTTLRDWAALGKPRLSSLVVMTALLGWAAAPGPRSMLTGLIFVTATAALVFAANTLNCVLEKDTDRLMGRTKRRPLPAGRVSPKSATWLGLGMAFAALIALQAAANIWTAALGAAALVSYVLVYTPMKRWSSLALYVGGIPGAIPPLMGWTAVTGQPDAGGWALFGILFAWQIPHFLAIALYLERDYAKGGMRVMSVAHGARSSRLQLLVGSLVLLAVSLLPWQLQMAGVAYAVAATLLGSVFVLFGLQGLANPPASWPRRVFLYSLAYLPLLSIALLAG